MNLELIFLDKVGFRQKSTNLHPLISLKLEHLPVLRMLHNSSIAGELLLANPHDLLEVVLLGQSLHGGEGLPSVPLLDPDVDDGVLHTLAIALVGVSEGVEGDQVLNVGHVVVCWSGGCCLSNLGMCWLFKQENV